MSSLSIPVQITLWIATPFLTLGALHLLSRLLKTRH